MTVWSSSSPNQAARVLIACYFHESAEHSLDLDIEALYKLDGISHEKEKMMKGTGTIIPA